jgi:hypothetical protein
MTNSDMIGTTVERELERRGGCRYGLQGVRVSCGDGTVYCVHDSDWGAEAELVLTLIPPKCSPWNALEGRKAREDDFLRAYSLAELDQIEPRYPEGTLHKVPAGICCLLAEWPVVCCPRD